MQSTTGPVSPSRLAGLFYTESPKGGAMSPHKAFNRKSVRTTDCYSTPRYATDLILQHLNPKWRIWEPCCGEGAISDYLREKGFTVTATDIQNGKSVDAIHDGLKWSCPKFNAIVTNPPFSLKSEFIRRCFWLGKPFALLLPLETLCGTSRTPILSRYNVQLIIPDRRVNYQRFDKQQQTSPNYGSLWLTWKFKLPRDLNFVEMRG